MEYTIIVVVSERCSTKIKPSHNFNLRCWPSGWFLKFSQCNSRLNPCEFAAASLTGAINRQE